MAHLIVRRLAQMLLIMAVVTLALFAIFDSDQFRRKVAVSELGGFGVATLSEQDYQAWLDKKGLNAPFATRYVEWIGAIFRGDLGRSIEKNVEVSTLLKERLANTAILAGFVFLIMIPVSLTLGVLAGMREGSILDRVISIFAVITTSIPQIATAVLLTVVLALGLNWVPTKSAMVNGWSFRELLLPLLTLLLYDIGYVVRMTRAAMAEVMTSHYIRTAILKGLPYRRVILRHALRNALIVPFTLIFLQLNWLLSEVVVVEVFFQYSGFGRMLFDATMYGDIQVVQAATLVAVFVAVMSQLLSDIGYVILNPRVRFG
ncbi:ABC transporter permease [Labrys wisconsinensis]|uniref:Peptide/nickel transport system permease protein n=1 Tax=Labrys wisconsinensis TaxID=425677 RepID=A0ABU0JJB4_9HYPH|nr:ABC transporter permease [Labrys wisconsinensis]MDQ0474369.1 peptide/nickel transport system permease protein [Labrys wisconsinensis]